MNMAGHGCSTHVSLCNLIGSHGLDWHLYADAASPARFLPGDPLDIALLGCPMESSALQPIISPLSKCLPTLPVNGTIAHSPSWSTSIPGEKSFLTVRPCPMAHSVLFHCCFSPDLFILHHLHYPSHSNRLYLSPGLSSLPPS